jgi:hypothetical protein
MSLMKQPSAVQLQRIELDGLRTKVFGLEKELADVHRIVRMLEHSLTLLMRLQRHKGESCY